MLCPKTVTGFLLILSLCACSGVGDSKSESQLVEQSKKFVPGQENIVTVTRPVQDESVTPYVKQFALMALFAKTAYRKDLEPGERKAKECEYIGQPMNPNITKNMPVNDDGSGWRRLAISGACYSDHGLYFETYIHTNSNKDIDQAVIAIRGTEPATWDDWKANLNGVIPFPDGEYQYAKINILPLIDILADQMMIKKIYLSGHSLGGGLAQSIARLSNKVTATYAFNTSPVTNWLRQTIGGETQNGDPEIYRIYQNREWLEFVRNVTTRFNIERRHRSDYRFHFVDVSVLDAHDMSHLVCQFAARVGKDGADYDYSYASARAVLNDRTICPDSIRQFISLN